MIGNKFYIVLWIASGCFISTGLSLQLLPFETYGAVGERLLNIVSTLRVDWIFSEENRFDLWAVALLAYMPLWIWQVRNQSKLIPYFWFFMFSGLGTIFLDSGLYSRLAFSLGVIPIVLGMMIAADQFRRELEMSRFDVRFILHTVLCLVIAIPGFYFPPFYDGISGWTVKTEDIDLDRIVYDRLEAIDAAGNTAPFPYPCFSPITQEYRFLGALNFADKNPLINVSKTEFIEERSRFFNESYQRCLAYLRQGMYPYQWVLGDFAYPTHNLSKKPDPALYHDIDGSRLSAVELVSYVYTRGPAGGFESTRRVIDRYSLNEPM